VTSSVVTQTLELQALTAEAFAPYGIYAAASDAAPDWIVSGDRTTGVVEDTRLRGTPLAQLWKLGDLAFDSAPYMGFVRYQFQGFRVAELERHRGEKQVWLGVAGSSAIVVATGDMSAPVPDLETAAAFHFEPGDLIAIGRGVWHVHFLPLTAAADFTVITARRDPEQDRDLVDLSSAVGVTLEVSLQGAPTEGS